MLSIGHTPSTAGTFRKKFRRNSGKTPETLSELFLEFTSRVRLGCPKPYNSRHLRLPEHFQNCLPPSTAGGASFFRSGSGEGLSEPVMEFPAVLGVFLNLENPEILGIQRFLQSKDPFHNDPFFWSRAILSKSLHAWNYYLGIFRGLQLQLSEAKCSKSQIASDLKSRSPNRKSLPQIAAPGSSNRTFKSRDLWFEPPLFKSPLESQCQFLVMSSSEKVHAVSNR